MFFNAMGNGSQTRSDRAAWPHAALRILAAELVGPSADLGERSTMPAEGQRNPCKVHGSAVAHVTWHSGHIDPGSHSTRYAESCGREVDLRGVELEQRLQHLARSVPELRALVRVSALDGLLIGKEQPGAQADECLV